MSDQASGTGEDGQVSREHPAVHARGRRLAELILLESGRAGLSAGARLPTERQLAAALGVTRSGIRRALAALEADGLISREVGRGTFIREAGGRAITALREDVPDNRYFPAAQDAAAEHGPPGTPGSPVLLGAALGSAPLTAAHARDVPSTPPDFAPADVMTVRRMLEPQAMPLVVVWATARDFGEMERCLAGGDHAASYEEFEAWDLALHRCIVAAAHSPLLTQLYGVVEKARHGQIWGDLKRRSASRERRELYQADHRAIVAALRARDADGAVQAMRAHLARVAGHLLGETR